MPDLNQTVLEVHGVTKRFPGVIANADVDLTLHRGEILALLGENGAGKSTLMNIIYGLYRPDEGTIRLKGRDIHFASPREAIQSGIGMVHQHFQLIPVMTVADNVLLGEEASVSGSRKDRETGKLARSTFDDTPSARRVRLVWRVIWNALIPVVAILIGLFVSAVITALVNVIATYLAPASLEINRDLPLAEQASAALTAYYPTNPTVTGIILWLPVVAACLFGALAAVRMYRAARHAWLPDPARPRDYIAIDSMVNALLDLGGTFTQIQNRTHARAQVRDISRRFNLEVNPDAMVEELPVGTQQRVEIVKALYRKADVLILDEPTAVLTPQEGQELFRIMRDLAAQGVSIIFITHKLKEVLAVADSIVVMRGGRVVGTAVPWETTEAQLAAMMVGRDVLLSVDKKPSIPRDPVLVVRGLNALDDRKAQALKNVSFEVRVGEVLGIAGVQGNGQTELVEVLTGLRAPTSGSFTISGEKFNHADPRALTDAGSSHVPEDRHRYGMVKTFPITDNLVLNRYYDRPFAVFPSWRQLPFALVLYIALFAAIMAGVGLFWASAIWPNVYTSLDLANLTPRQNPAPFITALIITLVVAGIALAIAHIATTLILNLVGDRVNQSVRARGGLTRDDDAIDANARQLIQEFDIRTPGISANGGNLSGGNQQKMVVAREFSRKPKLLIASQPTRGIDVGSIEFIHKRIIQQRDEGAAVLLVSAELDEILNLSDRIAVMYHGEIIAVLGAHEANRERLGLLMAGVQESEAKLKTGAVTA